MQLEHDLSGAELFPQLCIPRNFRILSTSTSPLTRSTITIWDFLCKSNKWLQNSPLMHLTGHSFFPPGELEPQFCTWVSQILILFHHVISLSGLLPITSLLKSTRVAAMEQWRYQQLVIFVKSLPKPLRTIADLTGLHTRLHTTSAENNFFTLQSLTIAEAQILTYLPDKLGKGSTTSFNI